jgi:hypothetical protein
MSPRIEVEEISLEDLILLGEDKLIDVLIEYPTENGKLKAKAKIKQLTMKELKNIDLTKITAETSIKILEKALFKQDGTPFSKDLIMALPMGVVNALGNEIMRISGAGQDMGF